MDSFIVLGCLYYLAAKFVIFYDKTKKPYLKSLHPATLFCFFKIMQEYGGFFTKQLPKAGKLITKAW